MRMHELRGEKELRKYLSKLDREGVADELISFQGFKRMGGSKGAYSNILVHPGFPYIVKIFDEKDTGYMRFLDVVSANQKNPHFPRFRGRPMRVSPGTIGIRMERLVPMPRGEFDDIEYMLHNLSNDPTWERTLKPGDSAKEFLNKWPEFSRAIMLLRRSKSADVGFDWHGGNIMKRRDGTPVITDPFEPRNDPTEDLPQEAMP